MRKHGGLTRVGETKMLRNEFLRTLSKAMQHVDTSSHPDCDKCFDRGFTLVQREEGQAVHEYAQACSCPRDLTWEVKLPAGKKQVSNASDHTGGGGGQDEQAKATVSVKKVLPLRMELDQHFAHLDREQSRADLRKAVAHHQHVTEERAGEIHDFLGQMRDMDVPESEQVKALNELIKGESPR